MAVLTVRVDDKLKERMAKCKELNWSEFIRSAIEERVEIEAAQERHLDQGRLEEAIKTQDRIRAKTSGKWSGVKEIRKWRDTRRSWWMPRSS